MKKFNVLENMQVATGDKFKESIRFAVDNTNSNRNYSNDIYSKSFVGTVVTFNKNIQEVEVFSLYDFVDIRDENKVKISLKNKLANISSSEKYSENEFVAFVEASDFEYHGYVGHVSQNEQNIRQLKIDNIFMSLYINILTNTDVSESIESLDLSVRTHNCLKRAGIETVKQLKALSLDEVMRIRNLGRNSFDELEQVLNIKFA